MRRDVRILLVGDEAVGKSTIITSLIKESYVAQVQHIVPEVTIPPEVTPENVTTYIVDSGSQPHDKPHLESEIRKAHVICIVYAVDAPQSFDRIPAYWLPYIRTLGVNVPVILIGNKVDLRGGQATSQDLENEISPIMNEFKEVETCVECSAKTPLNISEAFYFAQKAVLYPIAPLYDSRDHILKLACSNALKRIFKLCDTNKDGILDDAELNEFQRKCFDAPLQTNEVEGIKDLIQTHCREGIQGGITELGFLYLHMIFIRRGRSETTWTVLRRFGYAEDLRLTEAFLNPKFDVPYDCSVELSAEGYNFLTELFEVSDKDRDGALNWVELENLFNTSPGNPWLNQHFPETTVTDDNDNITLQGWLAQWSMTTLLDHKTTLAYLAYLGYPRPLLTALQTTPPRKAERRRRRVTRNVFLCYVCGAAGSGKSSLLRDFVGKPYRDSYQPTSRVLSVVNSVEVGGEQKYVVLQEFGSKHEAEMLRNPRKIELADVVVYLYDSSDTNSFSYISNLRQQYALDQVPALFVATKSDLDLALQRHEVQPDVYCRRLVLPVPVAVSFKARRRAEVFQEICRISMNPINHFPGGFEKSSSSSILKQWLQWTALIGGFAGGLLFAYRVIWRPGGSSYGWRLVSWLGALPRIEL